MNIKHYYYSFMADGGYHKRKISYSLNIIMDNCQDLRGFFFTKEHTHTHTHFMFLQNDFNWKNLACVSRIQV